MRGRLLGGLLSKALAAAASSSSSSAAATSSRRSSSFSSTRGGFAAAAEAAAAEARRLGLPGPHSPPLLSSRGPRTSSFSPPRSFSSSASSWASSSRASRKKAASPATAQQRQEAKAPTTATATATAAAIPSSPSPPPASRRVANSRYTMTPAAGPGGSMGMSLRASPVASGVLAEPFRGDPPAQPLSSWVTPSGWRLRWRRWVSGAKSMYSLAKCKRLVPGWTLPSFKREALGVYEATCRALAAGDRGALRRALTPTEYAAAKAQLRAREQAGWARVEWALAPPRPDPGRDVEVVHARLVMANAKDERAGFAQVTVRVRCRHSFEARDARGRVVASGGGDGGGGGARGPSSSSSPSPSSSAPASGSSDSNRVVDVVDTWVLERFLGGGPSARWRLAGRLSAAVGSEARGRGRGGFLEWLASRKGASEEK